MEEQVSRKVSAAASAEEGMRAAMPGPCCRARAQLAVCMYVFVTCCLLLTPSCAAQHPCQPSQVVEAPHIPTHPPLYPAACMPAPPVSFHPPLPTHPSTTSHLHPALCPFCCPPYTHTTPHTHTHPPPSSPPLTRGACRPAAWTRTCTPPGQSRCRPRGRRRPPPRAPPSTPCARGRG